MLDVAGVVVVGGADQGAPVPGQGEDLPPLAGRDDAGGGPGREVVAVDQHVGAAARLDPRHVLLLDHLLGADAVGEDAGRVDDVLGLDLEALARLGLEHGDAGGAPVGGEDLGHLGAVQHHRAEALGLAEDREHEPHVVGLAVVEEVGVARVARLERRDHLEHLIAVDRPVAVRRPVEVLVLLLGGAHLAAAAADPGGRHHVVHVEPGADFAVAAPAGEGGDQERRRVDEVRGQLHHQLALEQRLADQAEVEVLQVAQAAVDHLRGAAGGADGVVAALEQRHRVAARGGVEGDAGAGDPAADDDDLEALPGDRLDRRRPGQHAAPPAVSMGLRGVT